MKNNQEPEYLTSEEIVNRALGQVERDIRVGSFIWLVLGLVILLTVRWLFF